MTAKGVPLEVPNKDLKLLAAPPAVPLKGWELEFEQQQEDIDTSI